MKRAMLHHSLGDAACAPPIQWSWRRDATSQHRAEGKDPIRIDLRVADEIGLWCSLPAAISSHSIKRRPPRLHLHVRPKSGGPKVFDTDVDAVFIGANDLVDVGVEIEKIGITPNIAFDFVRDARSAHRFEVLSCSHCFRADLAVRGSFSPIDRRFCSNCRSDQTTATTLSTLLPASRRTEFADAVTIPRRDLDLDQLNGCTYTIWASTPALIWTAQRPQEVGIHVHAERGRDRVIDETFASVRLNGKRLDRTALLDAMLEHSDV